VVETPTMTNHDLLKGEELERENGNKRNKWRFPKALGAYLKNSRAFSFSLL